MAFNPFGANLLPSGGFMSLAPSPRQSHVVLAHALTARATDFSTYPYANFSGPFPTQFGGRHPYYNYRPYEAGFNHAHTGFCPQIIPLTGHIGGFGRHHDEHHRRWRRRVPLDALLEHFEDEDEEDDPFAPIECDDPLLLELKWQRMVRRRRRARSGRVHGPGMLWPGMMGSNMSRIWSLGCQTGRGLSSKFALPMSRLSTERST
ncbi:hypothetical protein K431DRAFT_331234 [Polychaeton citri CBS 116435]|uniref:Uncharacterized protein n=1 Tax=Polychaeton citri CBS 116435 TaxID=1314669 RepID=A0A9P4Q2A1_9PEZI|nr:hypothetical protein K431DRAFT_331234 [Polychaeton citri CBS 116435]